MCEDFIVYGSTGGITADTPIELMNGSEYSVAITIGPHENITLDFEDVESLERLRNLATEGVPLLRAKLAAIDCQDERPAESHDDRPAEQPAVSDRDGRPHGD